MRIDRIELRQFKMPLVAPFETSFGVELEEQHVIVRVDAEGLTGWGESPAGAEPFYSYETNQTVWHICRDFLIPNILGQDIHSIDDFIERSSRVRSHNMAKAGLEFALWDLFAKARGVSMSQMLGGTRDRIAVGVSIGIQSSPEALVQRIEDYSSQGYKRIKIKIAPGRDLQFTAAARKAFPNILLQVDANSAYTLNDADRLCALDEYNLLLIEQPLGHDDIYDHSKLQPKLKTPICLDESIHSVADAREGIELGACRIINIKPGRVGGFAESIKIHDLCAAHNIPVWHGGMLESGIGRAANVALASLPNFTLPGDISANKRYFAEDIVTPEFTVDADGMLTVPTKPGIGVEVLKDRLEKVTVRREEFRA
ncbi:MAG: o-succinylbenzoate synthase [Chloroflexi bacterium]|nr:o-succinylbenzoate synthase [Chloroflexota bacterium]